MLVILLGVSTGPRAPDEVRAVIPFVLGAVSLSYATGLLSGWVQAPVPDRTGTAAEFEGRNTTHFSVIDRDGNAVSNTYT